MNTDRNRPIIVVGYRGIATASPIFVHKQDQLYKNARYITPIEGYQDFVVHGDQFGFAYPDGAGHEVSRSVDEFAQDIIDSGFHKGGSIRLISCSAGKEGGIAAQGLADRLGIQILAPTKDVHVFPNGDMIVADTRREAVLRVNSGVWKLFEPRRKEGEYT